jgi:Fe-S oxidoreductase
MKGIADAVAHLTVDLGGTISCEHGDGLTRSGYLELQFGELYDVMRQVKALWDPRGVLNPGKVITDVVGMYTDDLRMGPDYKPLATGGAFDREPWQTELGRCHGCGTCRAYCPVYLVTGDEVATPRGKANLLRAAISGDLAPEDMADAKMKAVADLCYNCKTCLVECPSHVNIPGLVLKHKEHLAGKGRLTVRERMLLNVRPMGRLGSMAAPLSNALLSCGPVRSLMAVIGGISRQAPVPRFTADPIAEGRRIEVPVTVASVAYFAGCFELFNESDIARAALRVLQAVGCEVVIPTQRCCGIPKISAGDVKGALKDMEYNLSVLAPLAEAGYTITSGCPSCVLTLVTTTRRFRRAIRVPAWWPGTRGTSTRCSGT